MLQVISEYVGMASVTGETRALDMCSGPGSCAAEILKRHPDSFVVALDKDPWLLEVGRRSQVGARIAWIEADITSREWTQTLPCRSFDAAVLTTATSWLTDSELCSAYGRTFDVLKPKGVLIVGDRMPAGPKAIRRLASEGFEQWHRRQLQKGGISWQQFWRDAERVPEFKELLQLRLARVGPRRPRVLPDMEFHSEAMRRAGFDDVGEVWRFHDVAVLVGVK